MFQDVADVNIYDILEPCYHSSGSSDVSHSPSRLPMSFRKLGERKGPMPVRKRMFGRAFPLRLAVKPGRVPTWNELQDDVEVPCMVSYFPWDFYYILIWILGTVKCLRYCDYGNLPGSIAWHLTLPVITEIHNGCREGGRANDFLEKSSLLIYRSFLGQQLSFIATIVHVEFFTDQRWYCRTIMWLPDGWTPHQSGRHFMQHQYGMSNPLRNEKDFNPPLNFSRISSLESIIDWKKSGVWSDVKLTLGLAPVL